MAGPKKLESTALLGLVLQAAFLLTCFFLGAQSNSRAVSAEFWFLVPGLLVWFLVLVHGRQRRLAREEREERERLRETRLSEEIFEETELDSMRAGGGLLIFEKYLVPFFSVVLSGLLLYFAYHVIIGGAQAGLEEVTVQKPAAVAVGMVFIAFVGFLIGKYAAGLAQSRGYRLLRAAGGYVLGNVIAAVLIAISMTMYYFGVTWGETVLTYVIPTIMALVALEILLNLVLDIYRPRVVGRETRPPYDSRLLGLFAEPEGVLRTVAATLDYQFGFKVSDTWFYHFMERAILPLLLVQILSLWLLTTVVVVDRDEIAFIEKFGTPYVSDADASRGVRATVFKPGFYLKAPWPFSVARHVPAYRIHSVALGKIRERTRQTVAVIPLMKQPDIILWSERHIDAEEGFEVSFLAPSTVEEAAVDEDAAPKVNLARVMAYVHYRVKRKPDGDIDENAAFAYYYRHSDIRRHVEQLGYRALSRIAASQDFLEWMAEGREETVRKFRQEVREAVEREGLGLEVVFVGIPVVHPPAETAAAYADVVTALQDRESFKYEGELEYNQTVADAHAQEVYAIYEAEGYAARRTLPAQAEADEFLARLDAYRKAPMVYRFRTYFDVLEEALAGLKLYVAPDVQSEVLIIDLEEKLRPQLLEFEK